MSLAYSVDTVTVAHYAMLLILCIYSVVCTQCTCTFLLVLVYYVYMYVHNDGHKSITV